MENCGSMSRMNSTAPTLTTSEAILLTLASWASGGVPA